MIRSVSLALALVVVSSAATVHAGGTNGILAGRWSGKQTCKGIAGGVKTTFESSPDLAITHDGTDLSDLNVRAQNGAVYDGDVIEITGKANQAAVILSECRADPEGSTKGEMVHGTLKIKKNGDIQLKAISVFSFLGDAFTCKWKYDRTDTTPPDPAVPSCSELDPI
jgi:hypothetical protein